MNIIACRTFATIVFLSSCLAQTGIDENANDAVGFFAPALSGAIASVQSAYEPSVATNTDLPSQATSNNVATITSSPQTSATSSTASLASMSTSITSSQSSTSSTAKTSSSTTSTAKSSSSTSSAARSSSSTTSAAKASATASPSHHPSAKVGIGVGVPLGISFLALIGFLILRHRRHKEVSRGRHHGIIAAAGLYPVNDEDNNGSGGTVQTNMTDVENRSESQGHEKDDVHEILGTEIPAHSRELIGSPGVPRQELGMRHGSL